jgi:hypothetical protein
MSSRYSNDIIRSEVILFTGAGASCPLGFPALDGLLRRVIDKIAENNRWYHISLALGLFKDDPLKPLLNLEELLERLDVLVAMRDFEEEYETPWFSDQPGLGEDKPGQLMEPWEPGLTRSTAQPGLGEDESGQQAFFTPQFKSDLEAALELRQVILLTIRDQFAGSSDSMEKVVDLYWPLFELLRKESGATAIPVFTTNYDLALEEFTDRARSYGYGMIDGFDREIHAMNLPWDPDVYHRFSFSATKPMTLVLFKLHGSVFWQKSGEQIVFNRQPTLEEIEYVLLYPMQTKTIVEDPFLTCYNYFEECLRNAKLMIAIGYSFGDDYLNQVIARCQLANPELKIMVFNPGFKDHSARREKFGCQIGFSDRNQMHPDHFEIGEQGKELLRKVEREVLGLRRAKIVYQHELNFAELDKTGSWTQQDNEYVAERGESDEPQPVQLYLQSSSVVKGVIDAVYEVQFTAQIDFPSGKPDDWYAGVWLYQMPERTDLKYWLYASRRGILALKPRGKLEQVSDAMTMQPNTPHVLKVKMEYGSVYYFVDGKQTYQDHESNFKVQQIAIAAWASRRPFKVRISDLKVKWRIR